MSRDELQACVFDAVLFDMDGTLIDSTPAVIRNWLRWAEEFDVPAESLIGMHGVPGAQIIDRLLPEAQRERALARIIEIEENDVEGIVTLPGAVAALTGPPADRVAIATSCTRGLAAVRIEATGLPVPAVLVVADDTPVGKPDPAPYLLAAQRLGFDPARCLVVEDATAGVQAGRAAGCATLAVLTHLEPGSSGADAEVTDLTGVEFSGDGDGVRLRFVDGEQP